MEEDLVAQVDQTLPREKIHDPGSPKVTPRRVLTPGRRLSLPQPPSTPRTPVRRRKKSIRIDADQPLITGLLSPSVEGVKPLSKKKKT